MNTIHNNAAPFSGNPIMVGYDSRLFDADTELGYAFPDEQVVGAHVLVSLEKEIVRISKKTPADFFVLNVGDSSTSGWNSDLVFKGCTEPKAALFSYKTYSDFLEENGVKTLNAGVPGYTTYQAKKYLVRLLKKLAGRENYPDYVTVYLGNNDCAFNEIEDKTRIDFKVPSPGGVLTRVSEEDFFQNYEEIISTIKYYGATPIVIIPASNPEWPPGLRSKKFPEELERQKGEIQNPRLLDMFAAAQEAYRKSEYALALEKDFFLPRMKYSFRERLRAYADRYQIPLIDAQQFVASPEDFVDYCHPGEKMNEVLASAIQRFLKRKNTTSLKNLRGRGIPSDTYTFF